ncbi:hypothetical protein XENOCAPTIV_024743 [Xenoophorus captivus]|uniref:Dynein heavy chain AAA lid domain-containing protein n=1 Tax=Xenoophorus captivus TaxID=1517983 RepID=A0ABV0SJ02_9TELE
MTCADLSFMFLFSAPIGQAVHMLLLIQTFRPDRLLAMSHIFVSKVLGETFMNIIEQPLDLANIVDSEVLLNILFLLFLLDFVPVGRCGSLIPVKPSTPVLMCSVPGYDASGLVRDLAAEQNKQITSDSFSTVSSPLGSDKIPWAALKTLMAQSIYGGRIDNEFDQRLLITFLDRIFTKGSFDSEFKLALKVDGQKDIKMPDGIRREEFMHWVELLPDTQTPSWLGLPSNAEKVLLTTQGRRLICPLQPEDYCIWINVSINLLQGNRKQTDPGCRLFGPPLHRSSVNQKDVDTNDHVSL